MENSDFDKAVERALAGLPDTFQRRLQNVVVTVQSEPDLDMIEEFDTDELMGLYLGVPLIERSVDMSGLLPDQIILFQGPLERACQTREELEDEIRVTVIHEVGHFFGLNEYEIEEALEAPRRARRQAERG